jgi:hypothetical protein
MGKTLVLTRVRFKEISDRLAITKSLFFSKESNSTKCGVGSLASNMVSKGSRRRDAGHPNMISMRRRGASLDR